MDKESKEVITMLIRNEVATVRSETENAARLLVDQGMSVLRKEMCRKLESMTKILEEIRQETRKTNHRVTEHDMKLTLMEERHNTREMFCVQKDRVRNIEDMMLAMNAIRDSGEKKKQSTVKTISIYLVAATLAFTLAQFIVNYLMLTLGI